MSPWPRLLLFLVLAGALLGCTETDETLHFDGAGGGTYRLVVRWDADLWQQVGGVLGPRALRAIEGRPLPLTAAAWRDAATGIPGVEVETIERVGVGRGWQQLTVALTFRSLEALFQVEPLARRSLRVVTRPAGRPGAGGRVSELVMTPLTAVPVLDPLAALAQVLESSPAAAGARAPARDPGPLRRMGVEAKELGLIRRLLEPALAKVRLRFRVEVPGVVQQVGGRAVLGRPDHAEQAFDFAALRDTKTDRRVRVTWRMRKLDTPPALDHVGDRDDPTHRGLDR